MCTNLALNGIRIRNNRELHDISSENLIRKLAKSSKQALAAERNPAVKRPKLSFPRRGRTTKGSMKKRSLQSLQKLTKSTNCSNRSGYFKCKTKNIEKHLSEFRTSQTEFETLPEPKRPIIVREVFAERSRTWT